MAVNTNQTPSGHSFIAGNACTSGAAFRREGRARSNKVVAQLPERDGQFEYRIRSGGEPFYRTVNENELEVDGGGALTSASSNELRIDECRCAERQHETPSVCGRSEGPRRRIHGHVIECLTCGNYEVAGGDGRGSKRLSAGVGRGAGKGTARSKASPDGE